MVTHAATGKMTSAPSAPSFLQVHGKGAPHQAHAARRLRIWAGRPLSRSAPSIAHTALRQHTRKRRQHAHQGSAQAQVLYGDTLDYACEEGYRVDTNNDGKA